MHLCDSHDEVGVATVRRESHVVASGPSVGVAPTARLARWMGLAAPAKVLVDLVNGRPRVQHSASDPSWRDAARAV